MKKNKLQINEPTEGRAKRVYFYITEEEKKQLQALASSKNQSTSLLVKNVVIKEVKKQITILDLDLEIIEEKEE